MTTVKLTTMKTNSLGFIGGGRITRIFLKAFANKEMTFEKVVVFDTNTEVINALKKQFPEIVVAETALQAAQQPTVFIALHPPVIMETLDKISDEVKEDTIVISLAPKISFEKFTSKLQSRNIARMIPNATSFINEGFNPISYHPEMGETEKQQVKKLVKSLGKTFKTEEAKLESYAIVSAMLPTYFWFQWQAVREVALQTGLSEKEAEKTIKATLRKAVKLFYNSGLTPAEVIDLIPVKPIGEHEAQITEIYQTKLMGLFSKIKP
jgi:pyrroline-5-carboxylate reductase